MRDLYIYIYLCGRARNRDHVQWVMDLVGHIINNRNEGEGIGDVEYKY